MNTLMTLILTCAAYAQDSREWVRETGPCGIPPHRFEQEQRTDVDEIVRAFRGREGELHRLTQKLGQKWMTMEVSGDAKAPQARARYFAHRKALTLLGWKAPSHPRPGCGLQGN